MKTTKLILGILSGVFFIVIAFQSCAVTVGDALAENGGTSGFSGIMLAFCVLIGGVVGAAARNSKAGSIVAAVFYLLGALIGTISTGYADLTIWAIISAAFGVFFIISAVLMKKRRKASDEDAKGV